MMGAYLVTLVLCVSCPGASVTVVYSICRYVGNAWLWELSTTLVLTREVEEGCEGNFLPWFVIWQERKWRE